MNSSMPKWIGVVLMIALPGIFAASVLPASASMCDVKAFPDCQCNENQKSVFCRIYNESISKIMTFSGDNVPSSVEKIIIVSPYDSVNSTVVVEEARGSPLRLQHLSFVGIGELNIKAKLNQVECLYVLLTNVQQFADGVLSPKTDVTYVYDYDMYPGLGLNSKASRNILDYLFKSCETRILFKELDLKTMFN